MTLIWSPIVDGRGKLKKWVTALSGKSGVYLIRKPGLIFTELLYVGESHTGRVKKTLLRHFQKWKGKTAGPTYSREAVEVAVVIKKAVELQNRIIREMSPRDNIAEKEDGPF